MWLKQGFDAQKPDKSWVRIKHLLGAIIILGATNLTRLNCAPAAGAFNLKYMFATWHKASTVLIQSEWNVI